MAERIKLPLLAGFRIRGFEPIYSANIELKMAAGSYVVLGGNGLGKTTLMQAVVYGLAGGLDAEIEDEKSLRWSHGYFRGRLSPTQLASAEVEVDFKLGNQALSVRRGFTGSQVIAVREGRGVWNEHDAPDTFAGLLKKHGGYLDPTDFSFVVHRLLYLPESRRMIAWDTEAQIRLLMSLNQDIALERDFRDRRAQLKLLDSKKRHIHVALGKAQNELATLLEFEDGNIESDEREDESEQSITREEEDLPNLVAQLNEIGASRAAAEKRGQQAKGDLSRVSARIDLLREEIEGAEAGLVAQFLADSEREANLAIAKLVESMICPACGQKHAELADRARRFLREHRCTLCGSEEPNDPNPELDKLRREAEIVLREQQAFEEVVRLAKSESEGLRDQEFNLQARVNAVRFRRSAADLVGIKERNLPDQSVASLNRRKQALAEEEADAEAQIRSIRTKLEADYDAFRTKVDSRMDTLRRAYASYATSFLGLECELEEVERTGLIELSLYVPRFDGSTRDRPESCSEAQRFFLDIAFRLALIDATCGRIGSGSFICETPETALDFSYVTNVVSMFTAFARKQHNILLSANIQHSGIAEKIIGRIAKRDRARRIVNLLELGRLSTVQRRAKQEFSRLIKNMLSAPHKKG